MDLSYYLIAQTYSLMMIKLDYDFLDKSKLKLCLLQSKEKAGDIKLKNK